MLQSLLLTALGGILAVGGALTGAQLQAREARRIRKSQDAREDRYRLMTERVKAYGGFFAAAGAARAVISRQHTREEALEARNAAWEAYCLVALVGDDDTFAEARTLMQKLSAMAFDGAPFNRSEWGELIAGFIRASRLELIPARIMDS